MPYWDLHRALVVPRQKRASTTNGINVSKVRVEHVYSVCMLFNIKSLTRSAEYYSRHSQQCGEIAIR